MISADMLKYFREVVLQSWRVCNLRVQDKRNGNRRLNVVAINQVNIVINNIDQVGLEPAQRWEKIKVNKLVDTNVVNT